jgi:serine/threonine protein kinase
MEKKNTLENSTVITPKVHKHISSVVYYLANLDVEEDDKNSPFYKESITYINDKLIGTGSFGTVMQCVLKETNEIVAIKKILQNRKYKVRLILLI